MTKGDKFILLAFALFILLGGCMPSNSPKTTKIPPAKPKSALAPFHFADIANQAGISFTYHNGEEAGHFSILESLGGGAALFDYDNDGSLDVFFPGGGQFKEQSILGLPGALFRQTSSLQFVDCTAAANLSQPIHYSHGVEVGDYNNDGFQDFVITGYGGVVLYQNQGDGTFVNATDEAGLDDRLWSSSAAWCDVNADGFVDLFVVHYVDWSFENHPFCAGPHEGQREVCPPRSFHPLPDKLYISTGEGTFHDGSAAAGLRTDGKGLGIVAADAELDGDIDVYVGNDGDPNFLYRNDGRGHFQEVGLECGVALSDTGHRDGSMGVDFGDYNLDGLPDLWVSNFESESFAVYRNEGNDLFRHVSRATGVTAVGSLYVGWGSGFADFDRDGDEDVFTANGHVARYPKNAPLRQTPLLFENVDAQRFVHAAESAGDYMTAPHMGRGAAVGDVDNDGDLDLAISHTNEPVALLTCDARNQNHWIQIRLIGVDSNRDGIGTLVRLKTSRGTQIRQRKGGASYASSNDPRLHFGLKDVAEVERIEILWPSGNMQTLANIPADGTVTIVEGVATPP